jgi:hypothetical protein
VAIKTHLITYSLTDLKVAALSGETPGTLIDVPGIRQLDLNLTTEEAELRGDNKVIAIVDNGRGAEWSMEEGGLSMAALQVITGKTFADTGSTPNVVRRLDFKSTDSSPYFFIIGKANSDDGVEDLHVAIWKAKCTDNIEFSFQDGEFVTPTFGGRAIGRTSDDLLASLVEHETATSLVVPS